MNYEVSSIQQGWQCPICKRVYSPNTMMCFYCGGECKTGISTDGTAIDWTKLQSVRTASNKRERGEKI